MEDLITVVEGELSVQRGDSEIARLGIGELMGGRSLLDRRAAEATVVAHRETLLHTLPLAGLRSDLQADQAFAARFYGALCVLLAERLSEQSGGPTRDVEIVPETLDRVAVAGARFDRFLQHVRRP